MTALQYLLKAQCRSAFERLCLPFREYSTLSTNHGLTDIPSDMGDCVTIFVGPEKRKFTVHAELLKSASNYFATAMRGNWIESRTNVYSLLDLNVEAFETFVRWLYRGTLEVHYRSDLDEFAIHLWALGDQIMSFDFKNAAINVLWWF
jgi:hypothetical protein